MKIRKLTLLALSLGYTSLGLTAPTSGIGLYPAKEIVGLVQGQDRLPFNDGFFKAFTEAERIKAIEAFQVAFQRNFQGSFRASIDESSKYKTFVAALSVTRASRYFVKKGGVTELFLPVTVGLSFSNIVTGEVLYTQSETRYEVLQVLSSELGSEEVEQKIRDAYLRNFRALEEEILRKAALKFKPFEIRAGIARQWHGYFILDKGAGAGISVGDQLADADGNLLQVLHADKSYSIGVPVLVGKVKEGASFSKFSTASVSDVRKVSTVVLSSTEPGATPDIFTSQTFTDQLTPDAAFNVSPVNWNYQQILKAVARDGFLEQMKVTQGRSFPEYFIRLKALPPRYYEAASATSDIVQKVHEAYIFGEMLDGSGQVVYANFGHDKISDEVVAGMGFDQQARDEIVLKNAARDLALKFAKEVKFTSRSLPVSEVRNDRIFIEDKLGFLKAGRSYKLYRKLGTAGENGEVSVPIWEIRVAESHDGVAEAVKVLPTLAQEKGDLQPNVGDFLILDIAKAGAEGKIRLGLCGPDALKLGTVDFQEYATLAYFMAATQTSIPFYGGEKAYSGAESIPQLKSNLVSRAGFQKEVVPVQMAEPTNCLIPVYKVDIQKEQCAPACQIQANLVVGYRSNTLEGQKAIGLQQRISLEAVPQDFKDDVLKSELIGRTIGLMPGVLSKVVEQKY